MMGSLRCKQHFSSSMYHNSNINNNNNKNSNNKKISNIKISNNIINSKNYEKKNYNCFPSEPSKPNFPALLPSAATLTATDDRPNLRLRRPDAFLLPSSSSISSSPLSLPGHDWCPPQPAQDRVHTALDQPSSDSFGSH